MHSKVSMYINLTCHIMLLGKLLDVRETNLVRVLAFCGGLPLWISSS